MRDVTVLTETDLRACVPLNLAAIDVVEAAFRALATGEVVMPPILSMDLPMVNGEVDVKTAWIPGFDGFAIKVSPGFFDNPKQGIPSLNGLMILFDAKTGLVDALLLDNGYLTDVRTAAAGAVAARHLAPETVETAGVVGTGVQARLQLEAAYLVRPFRKVLVWGRNADKADACARDIGRALGVETTVAASAETVVRESDLVVTSTPSREPLIQAEWLHPGLHITAMGSDQDGKNEIDPTAIAAADLYVADRLSQCAVSGEWQAVLAKGLDGGRTPPELGVVIAGAEAGRRRPDDITIVDLTGTGAQDTAIATHALACARSAGAGSVIQT
ncbi:MAG: cyclodeaminase [Minwuia sp.]|uniref:cyclodeaminase n=1 Tax=Minwuia sp. TaxID=2493630 RepID=UPI003A87EDA0